MKVNAFSVFELSKICKLKNITLVQISSHAVFDGQMRRPYNENDKPNPINIYGKSKLLGENGIKNVLQDNNQYIILRTSWVMSPVGKNFIITMLNLLQKKDSIKVVDDQIDGGYITPVDAEGDHKTFISRIRKDNSNNKAINLWIVSDNLRKGAATNTVEIGEYLIKHNLIWW